MPSRSSLQIFRMEVPAAGQSQGVGTVQVWTRQASSSWEMLSLVSTRQGITTSCLSSPVWTVDVLFPGSSKEKEPKATTFLCETGPFHFKYFLLFLQSDDMETMPSPTMKWQLALALSEQKPLKFAPRELDEVSNHCSTWKAFILCDLLYTKSYTASKAKGDLHTGLSPSTERRNWGSKILKASTSFTKRCWEHLKAQSLWYFTYSLQHSKQRTGFSLNPSFFRDTN